MACSEATSSCHWLRTWSMASCLVFSDTVATALMVSISEQAWASCSWTEPSSSLAPSSATVWRFSSSETGQTWGGGQGGTGEEEEEEEGSQECSVWETDKEHSIAVHCVFAKVSDFLTLRGRKNNLSLNYLSYRHKPFQRTGVTVVPYLPWTGRALWTLLSSGWTRPPAAVWVGWTRSSPAPKQPRAAAAPLVDNSSNTQVNPQLITLNKKNFQHSN